MKHKNLFSIFALLLIFSTCVFAQNNPILLDSTLERMPSEFIVQDVRGKIANKPTFLPKPQYPFSAKVAGIEGTVRVAIKVGVEGNVTEAKAFEGAEELKKVCEETALRTRFVIAKNTNNEPFENEGHLTYIFEIKAANWIKIGYHLQFLQFFPITAAPLPTIIKTIPTDWDEETKQLKKLQTMQIEEFAKNPPTTTVHPRPPISGGGVFLPNRGVVATRIFVPIPEPPPAEQVSIVQSLVPAFQKRLQNDELNAWKFELGLGLAKTLLDSRNPTARSDAVSKLKF